MANCIKRNCSAFPCAREHNVLEEWLDDHGKQMFWVVDVKTFFDVAICHVLDREIRCKCNKMYHKCDYCISITPGLYSAFYFSYKNKKKERGCD